MSSEPIVPTVKNYTKSTDAMWARMTPLFILLSILHLSLLTTQSCGLDIEDPTPPSPPVWVEKSLPEEWPERGIDAHESGGTLLEWESNPENNISAYLIFRAEFFPEGDSIGSFDILSRIDYDSHEYLEYLDTDVSIRIKYYYKMKAVSVSGTLSTFSDSITYLLLPQIEIEGMRPNGVLDSLGSDRKLYWNYSLGIEMEDYCLTIMSQNNDLISRFVLNPSNYVSGTESWTIPNYVVLDSNQVYKWRIDAGAKYIRDRETAGSESLWASFLFSINDN
jgi:hypothetical protein